MRLPRSCIGRTGVKIEKALGRQDVARGDRDGSRYAYFVEGLGSIDIDDVRTRKINGLIVVEEKPRRGGVRVVAGDTCRLRRGVRSSGDCEVVVNGQGLRC